MKHFQIEQNQLASQERFQNYTSVSKSITFGLNKIFLILKASQSFHSTAGSFRSQTPSISRKTFRDSQRNIYVSGEGHDWSDLIPSYKKLFTNFAFLGLTGSCTADMGFVSIIGIYGIQFLAEVYNFSISGASIIFRFIFELNNVIEWWQYRRVITLYLVRVCQQ